MSVDNVIRLHAEPDRKSLVPFVALGAVLLSLVAFAIALGTGTVLTYKDAMSHLALTHRSIFGMSSGLAQFGGVWPPLPHLLVMPLLAFDGLLPGDMPLYRSGVAGSIVSMTANVATVVVMYKMTLDLSGRRTAGLVSAAIMALNVNLLYLQATPMTESLLFCTILVAAYAMQRWATTNQMHHLLVSGFAVALATLTRYEAWAYLLVLTVAMIAISCLQQRPEGLSDSQLRRRIADRVLLFLGPAFAGVLSWMVWNAVIFGNPFNFQTSDYAKPPLEPNEPAVQNLSVALQTYWFAMVQCVGLVVLVFGVVGLAAFMARELRIRRTALRAMPVLALLAVLVFFVFTIWSGQRPLHVDQINGEMYNVRYGLFALLPSAVFIGYLTGIFGKTSARYISSMLAVSAVLLSGVMTINDDGITKLVGIEHATAASEQVSRQFAQAYDGGNVLMESWYNENLAFESIPSGALVYEGTNTGPIQWRSALGNPHGQVITWIISRCGKHDDTVCRDVNPDQLAVWYRPVFQVFDPEMGDTITVYRHN